MKKSTIIFFSDLLKCHEPLLNHIAFNRYDNHIVYRLFLYILLPHCIYYTSHVKERWILLKPLCVKCGQLIYLFLWRHFVFAGSSPYYCIICAISMCYTCQLYDVCYLHISDILMFEDLKYSLEQYIGFVVSQAFIHYCGLHQVWREAENQVLILDLEASEV